MSWTAASARPSRLSTRRLAFAFQVQVALALFCHEPPTEPPAATPKRGSEAVMLDYAKIDWAEKDGQVVTYSDLLPCLTFSWLLDATQKARVDKIRLAVVARSGAAESSVGARKGSAKLASIDAKALVRAMCKKTPASASKYA